MKLSEFIKYNHDSISEFARSQGVLPSQVQRWLKRDCEVRNNEVWCRITKQVKNDSTT